MVDHGGGVFAVFEVFAVADVVEKGGEGDCAEVELGADEVRGVGVDVFGEADDSLDVFEVVGGVVLGHVLLDELHYREEWRVGVEGCCDGHDEEGWLVTSVYGGGQLLSCQYWHAVAV